MGAHTREVLDYKGTTLQWPSSGKEILSFAEGWPCLGLICTKRVHLGLNEVAFMRGSTVKEIGLN